VATEFASPVGNHLGLLVIIVPPVSGLIVGLMARSGSEGIRGHEIPLSDGAGAAESKDSATPHVSEASLCGCRYW
jgi:hypothetical protein